MPFNNSILIRACTFDELLSTGFQSKLGEKSQADLASKRLSAWCQASTSGNWELFARRLAKDQIEFKDVLARFANAELVNPESGLPLWVADAQWAFDALTQGSNQTATVDFSLIKPVAFGDILFPLLHAAYLELEKCVTTKALTCFNAQAKADLNFALLKQLSDLISPLLYSLFIKDLKSYSQDGKLLPSDADLNKNHYEDFISKLKTGGLEQLFNEKPVMIRLLSTITRQWINTTAELINRLSDDLAVISQKLVHAKTPIQVTSIEGDLSDPHNLGHSVRILGFDDGSKVVYKPKDLGLDIVWVDLIQHLNGINPPVQLKVVNTIACNGYGWCEFIEHESCQSESDIRLFYERSGALLMIFHLLASGDMHYENIIASGSYPVPIDLETILQASNPEFEFDRPAMAATNQAIEKIQNSVLKVGMLPLYAKSPKNKVFDVGGLNAAGGNSVVSEWKNINTNGMRWVQFQKTADVFSNIPHINSNYVKFGDYLADFIRGFEKYAAFLLGHQDSAHIKALWKSFRNLPVRKVVRPTRFYYALLQRLKDYRSMDDGITWSVQADFLARLGDWDAKSDLLWPIHKAEREALINLNIPFFVLSSDDNLLCDHFGDLVRTPAISGLQRAQQRWNDLNEAEIAWQSLIIKISTGFVSTSKKPLEILEKHSYNRLLKSAADTEITPKLIEEELASIIDQIDNLAFQDQNSISWLGLDWLQDSEVAQLVPLSADLYNGVSGVALFLAAYQRQFGDQKSKRMLDKVLNGLREQIYASTSSRWARSLGIGGAAGLGSVIYALTSIATILDDKEILGDALAASKLFTNELINADESLDVISGSAGAILSLLALYRQTNSNEVLEKAIRCGEHLLNKPRVDENGYRSWAGLGLSKVPLNGMSHGAAGFGYALTGLYQATHRQDFFDAAQDCLAYEEANYDEESYNWPDLREDDVGRPLRKMICQWCHGAPGIGLARIGKVKLGSALTLVEKDIRNAAKCANMNWPNSVDSLCCGTLGSIEFLKEAATLLDDEQLHQLGDQRLKEVISNKYECGSYVLGAGSTQFNLGFFRGLSGVGYTLLRRINPDLPNVLIWE